MLFSVLTQSNHWSDQRVVAQSLKTGERRLLVRGASNARYLPTGHIVYARGQTLMAAPFNPERLELANQYSTRRRRYVRPAQEGWCWR